MADDPNTSNAGDRMGDLVAPRRIYRRKNRRGLVLAAKIGLPLIAIVGVAYVVIWSRTHKSTINPIEVVQDVNKLSSDVSVKQVKYDGLDARNRPFSITAESAVQPQDAPPPDTKAADNKPADNKAADNKPADKKSGAENGNIINLRRPMADMTMSDGAWVAVTADNGVYDRDAGTVDLSGNVNLFHDTGLSFETDAAKVDLKNDAASGNQPIEGSRPDGEIAAEGFEVRDGGQTVVFTGRAYLKLYPKSSGSGAGGAASSPKG